MSEPRWAVVLHGDDEDRASVHLFRDLGDARTFALENPLNRPVLVSVTDEDELRTYREHA